MTIGHLFPELLNMYGDGGNISALKNRLLWRGMEAEVLTIGLDDEIDFSGFDILLLGGGPDCEQKMVKERLETVKDALWAYVEDGGVMLALCNSYPMLGKHFLLGDNLEEGLSLLAIDTEKGDARMQGDAEIVVALARDEHSVVGFENHSGKTSISGHEPFGMVCHGFGNNGEDKTCGVRHKNLFGTYLYGPLLPKNPVLTDYLLFLALERKYGERIELSPLFDQAEQEAHAYILKRVR